MLDLFGHPVAPETTGKTARRKTTLPRGHAAKPGSGPQGETCRTCAHYTHRYRGSRRHFRKCGLMKARWTCGPGTDVRAKDPACRFWERMREEV